MRSTADRGRDLARGIWIVDPLFLLDAVRRRLQPDGGDEPAREESYLAGARLHDTDLRAAAADDREQRAAARQRRAEATASNLGLGHDIRAALADPTAEQLDAGRQTACHVLAVRFPRRDRLRRPLDRPRTPTANLRQRPAASRDRTMRLPPRSSGVRWPTRVRCTASCSS